MIPNCLFGSGAGRSMQAWQRFIVPCASCWALRGKRSTCTSRPSLGRGIAPHLEHDYRHFSVLASFQNSILVKIARSRPKPSSSAFRDRQNQTLATFKLRICRVSDVHQESSCAPKLPTPVGGDGTRGRCANDGACQIHFDDIMAFEDKQEPHCHQNGTSRTNQNLSRL